MPVVVKHGSKKANGSKPLGDFFQARAQTPVNNVTACRPTGTRLGLTGALPLPKVNNHGEIWPSKVIILADRCHVLRPVPKRRLKYGLKYFTK